MLTGRAAVHTMETIVPTPMDLYCDCGYIGSTFCPLGALLQHSSNYVCIDRGDMMPGG